MSEHKAHQKLGVKSNDSEARMVSSNSQSTWCTKCTCRVKIKYGDKSHSVKPLFMLTPLRPSNIHAFLRQKTTFILKSNKVNKIVYHLQRIDVLFNSIAQFSMISCIFSLSKWPLLYYLRNSSLQCLPLSCDDVELNWRSRYLHINLKLLPTSINLLCIKFLTTSIKLL